MKKEKIEMSMSTAKNLIGFLQEILKDDNSSFYWNGKEPLFYFKKHLKNKIELVDKLNSFVDEVAEKVDSDIKLSQGSNCRVGMNKPKWRLEQLKKIEPFINMVERKVEEVS